MTEPSRPAIRTFLFAPGNHPRRVEKALTLDADAVILDLEDACPVADKIATRPVVVGALQGARRPRGFVRVNPLSTTFGYGDLVAVVRKGVDGIVLPKVETADELRTGEWLLTQLERENGLEPGSIDLMPIVETGKGLRNLDAIAHAATRVRRLAFGAGDFTLDMNLAWSREEGELLPYRTAFALASRAAGLEAPIDTVWVRVQDKEGFAASARRVRELGFQGKMCIYPDQIPVANAAFSPSPEQIAWAERVVAAFEEAEKSGSAAIQLDGQFLDYPIVYQAERVLASADGFGLRTKAAGAV
jgi:citrate lyase subunit beta/citryl-CoA lyase